MSAHEFASEVPILVISSPKEVSFLLATIPASVMNPYITSVFLLPGSNELSSMNEFIHSASTPTLRYLLIPFNDFIALLPLIEL